MQPALAAAFLLRRLVGWLRDNNSLSFPRSLCWVLLCLQGLLANYLVNLCENVLKGFFYVCGVQSGGFDKRQALLLTERLCIFCLDTTEMTQVTLIANKHDHYVRIGMVSQLLEPTANVIKGCCKRKTQRESEREVRGQSQVSMQNIKRIWREKRERYYEERLLLLCVVVLVGTPFFSSVTLLVSFLFLPCLVMS